MILVSNCPALPTNGSPCSSSSAPGASPTNMSCASMLPTPNATFLRDDARCAHLTQASARSRNAAKAAAFSGDERRGAGDGANLPGNQFQNVPVGTNNANQLTLRFDHKINVRQNLSAYYYFNDGTRLTPFN